MRMAVSSCQPQSQRIEWNTSPVRHLECMRTSTFSPSVDVAVDERDVFVRVDVVAVADDAPRAVFGGQPRLGHAVHEPFVLEPVRHELRDGDEGEPVRFGELPRARGRRAALPSSLRISQITPAG